MVYLFYMDKKPPLCFAVGSRYGFKDWQTGTGESARAPKESCLKQVVAIHQKTRR